MAADALLDRSVIPRARPAAKAVLALVLWANSAVTSILCAAWIEAQLTGASTPLSWIIGVTLTVLLSVAQVFTKDASAGGYLVALFPDVLTTAVQHQRWLVPVLRVLLGEVGFWLALIVAAIIGWYSARLPERLLFSRR
jgi:hypothetical protein